MDQFEQCIKENNVDKVEIDPEQIVRELNEAKFDLDASERSLAEKNFKWTTIQGHYSLEHSFNALLYGKGYHARDHPCLLAGIIKFFVEPGLIDKRYIKDFEYSHKVCEGEEHAYSHKEDFAMYIMNCAGEIWEIAQKEMEPED